MSNKRGAGNRFSFWNYVGGRIGAQIKNLAKQQPDSSKENKSDGITNWETEGARRNDFPQQLVTSIRNSPVASGCLDTWHDFIVADGFVNQEKTIL